MITLDTLPTATEQEVFDQIATHLLEQGVRCQTKGESNQQLCLYKNGKGLSCAAGCLIEEHQYSQTIEGRRWDELIDAGIVPNVHEVLIVKLQQIHDAINPRDWHESLYCFAIDRHLNPDVLRDFEPI